MKRIWLLVITAVACAQEPVLLAPLKFDVASVKLVQPDFFAPRGITTGPGRLRAQAVSIGALIAYAYGVKVIQIVDLKDGPGVYDVEGKADGAYAGAALRVMLQGLLAERFGLKLHREMREMAVDRLVIGKELKLHPTQLNDADLRGFTLEASGRGPSFLKAKATAISVERLADSLSDTKVVVDRTGLKGLYEFEVDLQYDRAEATDRSVPEREAANHIREVLISALGLRLEGVKKGQVEVLVIDQVERLEPN